MIARMRLKTHARIAASMAAITLAASSPSRAQTPPAAPATGPSIMLVFDGSGSMWGRLEGEKIAKFVTARDALKTTFGKMKPELRVGLTGFGHRRQGDCSDVQVVFQPQPLSDEVISPFLEKYNPKGRGPIGSALKEAAKALASRPAPRSLVLVHDDMDNCSVDVCALVPELQASAPGLAIHVVGIGVKTDDAQKYQCLATPTKGRHVDAQTAAQVGAAIEEVFKLASADPSTAPPRPPQPVAAAKAAPVTPPAPVAAAVRPTPGARPALAKDGAPGARLALVASAGEPPVARPVAWTITSQAPESRVVYAGRGQDQIVPLPAGTYDVEARDGMVTTRQTLTVPPSGQTALDVPMAAGVLRFAKASALAEDATIAVLSATTSEPLGILPAKDLEAGIAVPPGAWLLRAAEGGMAVDRKVDIAAGKDFVVSQAWPFGRLQVTIAGDAGGSRSPILTVIYEDDPDSPRGRREIVRSAAVMPEVVLPAGTYAIAVRQGGVEVRDRVVVQPGDYVKRTLTLAGTRLSLSSKLAGSAVVPADEPVAYRIERLDVVPPEVFAANRQAPVLEVPAGRYRIEARYGLANARASREVTLTAGQPASIVLEQQAGTLRLVPPASLATDILWEVLNADGLALWSTAQANPRVTLQAGRYTVRLEGRDRRLEQRVDVRPGETRTIELRDTTK